MWHYASLYWDGGKIIHPKPIKWKRPEPSRVESRWYQIDSCPPLLFRVSATARAAPVQGACVRVAMRNRPRWWIWNWIGTGGYPELVNALGPNCWYNAVLYFTWLLCCAFWQISDKYCVNECGNEYLGLVVTSVALFTTIFAHNAPRANP